MHLIFLCHPPSIGFASMPRFARMIGEGMRRRGHAVEYWTSPRVASRLPGPRALQKWLGYIDQFLIFPWQMRRRLRRVSADTIFIVTDHALGMWVPVVKARPNVIHCHDFLAQRSALGEFPENSTAFSGRVYQHLIRRGYRQGHHFVSVSSHTQSDLRRFLGSAPLLDEIVLNGLNYPFAPMERAAALGILNLSREMDAGKGFFVHVGGNQWYKNRRGVVELYLAYARGVEAPVSLLLIGEAPDRSLRDLAALAPPAARILFLENLPNEALNAAYSLATALLFPSLEEGFGWPIAEAQASGCLVITTNAAPMTEVGGSAAWYLPRRPSMRGVEMERWATDGAVLLRQVAALNPSDREGRRDLGIENARRFDAENALDQYEAIYRKVGCGL